MKLGVFGGSFNPPHMGHLIVLESVRDSQQFDRVMLIPSGTTPNKPHAELAPAQDRLEMTRLAVQGNSCFEVSDTELQRKGISYTAETLRVLQELYPRASLSLIIGADNFVEFDSWRSPGEIVDRAELLVMSRPGFSFTGMKSEYARHARFVNVPSIGISGTEIRRRVKHGRSIRYLVPLAVEEYIAQHRLYLE